MAGVRYFDPLEYEGERDLHAAYYVQAAAPAPAAPRITASRPYATQTPRTAAPTQFDYEEALAVDQTLRAACEQTLRQAGRGLPGSVEGVSLRFFVRHGGAPLRYEFSSQHNISGRIDPAAALIWISGVVTVEEGIRAVAHEVKHYDQIGRGMSVASKEQDAYIFAWSFWRAHGAGISSWSHTYGRLAH